MPSELPPLPQPSTAREAAILQAWAAERAQLLAELEQLRGRRDAPEATPGPRDRLG